MLNKIRFKVLLPALLLSIMAFQGFISTVHAGGKDIPVAINLQADGIIAREKGIPVLLEFTMAGCPFCEEIENEVLRPMLISGDYDNKVIVRNVMIDEETEITDFNGKKISYEELASRYSVYVAPTLVLVSGNGKAMGLDMVGVTTIDFYGAYLDQAIDKAISAISVAVDEVSAGLPTS